MAAADGAGRVMEPVARPLHQPLFPRLEAGVGGRSPSPALRGR